MGKKEGVIYVVFSYFDMKECVVSNTFCQILDVVSVIVNKKEKDLLSKLHKKVCILVKTNNKIKTYLVLSTGKFCVPLLTFYSFYNNYF